MSFFWDYCILSSYMGNIILVPRWFRVFFLNFHPPKPWENLQDRMVGFSNHPQFVGQQWKGGEMSSWKENFPAAKVFNM